MPLRHSLNAHFLAIASSHGLTSAIMDARSPECVDGARAADVLCARDEYGMAWIKAHRQATGGGGDGMSVQRPQRSGGPCARWRTACEGRLECDAVSQVNGDGHLEAASPTIGTLLRIQLTSRLSSL